MKNNRKQLETRIGIDYLFDNFIVKRLVRSGYVVDARRYSDDTMDVGLLGLHGYGSSPSLLYGLGIRRWLGYQLKEFGEKFGYEEFGLDEESIGGNLESHWIACKVGEFGTERTMIIKKGDKPPSHEEVWRVFDDLGIIETLKPEIEKAIETSLRNLS